MLLRPKHRLPVLESMDALSKWLLVNIGGATLSCRHITDGVKRLFAFYDVALQ